MVALALELGLDLELRAAPLEAPQHLLDGFSILAQDAGVFDRARIGRALAALRLFVGGLGAPRSTRTLRRGRRRLGSAAFRLPSGRLGGLGKPFGFRLCGGDGAVIVGISR